MIARWLVLALLLLLPLRALAATCTFTGSGNWTSATLYSGAISGCTSGVDLSADDSIIIANGATATVTTGSTVSMTTGAITVQSGGSLVVARGGNLAVPNTGLLVESGGAFTPRGVAVSYGDATPSLVTSLADAIGPANGDINTTVPLGKIIHCPGVSAGVNATSATAIATDCAGALAGEAGTRDEIAICWPDANINAELLGGFDTGTGTIGQQFYAEWLTQIAAGDVVVFWDATNQRPSRDVNSHYEVTFVNTQAANRCIGLSVRQGTTEGSCAAASDGCHLIDRDVRECTLAAAYTAGQRSVTCDAAAVGDLNQRAGRNLTCPADKDASGTVEPGDRQGVTITAASTADVLRLMPGGMPYNVPNGSVCWIDYGWKAGDRISVYKPAVLSQIQNGASCIADNNPVACCDGAGFGSCGPVTCATGSTCDFDFVKSTRIGRYTVFPTTTMDNTWIREASSAMQIAPINGAGPFTRLQLTSPAYPNSTLPDYEHGIGIAGGGTTVVTDSAFRHWGDDLFCPNWCVVSGSTCDGSSGGSTNTSTVYGMTLTRIRAEYAGCMGGSCALFDECGPSGGGGGAIQYAVTDLLAVDATEHTTSNGQLNLTNDDTAGAQRIRNAVMVANYSPLVESLAAAYSRVEMSNYYDIGRSLVSNTYDLITAHLLRDASIIDQSNTGSRPLLGNTQLRANAGPVNWQRVLFVDPDAPAATPTNMFLTDDAPAALTMDDIAIISPNRTGQADANTLWRLTSSGGASTVPIRYNRITIGMRPGETNEFTTGFYASTGGGSGPIDGGYRTMQNPLGAFFWRTGGASLVAYTIDAGLDEFVSTRPSPWCDVGSSTPVAAPIQAAMTTGVRDVRQAFTKPAVGNFTPVKGSWLDSFGCGARKVGARDMWALRVLGHDIYAGYGDTWKTKSGGGSKRGPRASP